LEYLTGSNRYNFYRERVGNAGYRIVYEISDDTMTVVGIVPKGEDTYDLSEFRRQMER
jgi:mRNA interferase RelE/StbE